jgi:short-subunit dehydrogenase
MSKSILITGATRGLGENLARQFAQRGYRVALVGRDQGQLDALQQELAALAPQVCTRVLDVANFEQVEPVLRECAQELAGLDIVVVNAGVAIAGKTGQGRFDDMRKTIDVNLTGAIATAEAALQLFSEQGQGQLVGVTSVAAVRGMPGQAAYSATKAGFGKYLEAARLDYRKAGIKVTELAPGYIDTDLNRSLKSRPFLVSAEKGTRVMADLIEREVDFRFVPPWPWSIVARLVKIAPGGVF